MDFKDILLGFEFEFTAPFNKEELKQQLRKDLKLPFAGKKTTKWSINYDSSITTRLKSHTTHELVSPPQKYERALATLDKICNWMQQYDCRTNCSTGLHTSMSFIDPELNKQIDPIKLIIFTSENILFQFKRQRNYYCQSYNKDFKVWSKYFKCEKVATWKDAVTVLEKKLHLYGEKYRIVNVCKWYTDNYVEFRAIGNANYHQRTDEVKSNIEKMAEALLISVDATAKLHAYEQAVSLYMQM